MKIYGDWTVDKLTPPFLLMMVIAQKVQDRGKNINKRLFGSVYAVCFPKIEVKR